MTNLLDAPQRSLFTSDRAHPKALMRGVAPFYETSAGAAYLGDSRELLKALPDGSVNLAFTSPPYALHFKKEYGNVSKADYVEWFLPFAREVYRVLTDDGSFVLNIGGSWNQGSPTRSLYHYKLMIALVEELGFHLGVWAAEGQRRKKSQFQGSLTPWCPQEKRSWAILRGRILDVHSEILLPPTLLAQECYWYNPAKMPVPAEWVTVRRVRIKDSVEHVWWLSKTPFPKADNRKVLKPYSADMLRLAKKGVKATVRPSGHNITSSFDKIESGGSIPSNVLEDQIANEMLIAGNNSANDPYTMRCKEAGIKIHPARFPTALPEFFVKLLTDEGDLVVDPFAGSNTAGMVAERLGRRWVGMELLGEYLEASKFRFGA